jgi:hypothetical protein
MPAAGPSRVLAQDPDRPAVGPTVALDDLDGRGLAGAVRPEQRDDLARDDAQRQVPDDDPAVVALPEAVDLDRRPIHPAGRGHEPPAVWAIFAN